MNALDLLSDEEDDGSANEATEEAEPDPKRYKVDLKDLKLGSRFREEDEKAKMEATFSSFEKAAMHSKTGSGAVTEIPGFATTYQIVMEGDPKKVIEKGCKVMVHATGVMAKSGKVFWESRETLSGKPHIYIAGDGKKVVGWEQGCVGMRMGEIRKLWIPGHEGYGARGLAEWEIPPDCDLEFTIECIHVTPLETAAGFDHPVWGKPASKDTQWRHESSSTSTLTSA